MPNSTRSRNDALTALCAKIVQGEAVDISAPEHPVRHYADILAELDGHKVGIQAYKNAWARYLRRARHPLINTWGGPGRGQGRTAKAE